ncbi:MAG: HAMP domain-containing histidine kinase, partial [Oligoflexales bacterium]|nr:HAMP domain-containing histidine kinase [Oligoflexales bacterium]
MKLQFKMLLTVAAIISVLTGIGYYIEVRWQMTENELIESEFQSIQTANAIDTFEYALWNVDINGATAGLLGLFQSPSVIRAQIVTSDGAVFLGFKTESSKVKTYSRQEKAIKPVADKQPTAEAHDLKNPLKPYSEDPSEKLVLTDIGGNKRRIIAALWFNKPDTVKKPIFIGHLIVDYSLDAAYSRAKMAMLRLVTSYAFFGSLMILFLFFAMKYQILSPIKKLENASQIIAGGDFSEKIELNSEDELGSLSRSLEKMRIELKRFGERLQVQVEQLEMTNTKLHDMDQQKTHFFQNISHELRTPLTLILNSLEQSLKTYPADQMIKLAFSNSMRLFRLVTQLLDFQKLSAGRKKVQLTPIRIADFLEACSVYIIPACFSKGITFYLDIRKNFDPIILGQIDALEKIIFNY